MSVFDRIECNVVFCFSWGPDDDGRTVDGPHPLGKVSLRLCAVLFLSSRGQQTVTDQLQWSRVITHLCVLLPLVFDCMKHDLSPQAALQHGVIAGRRGFGSIFVVASGNGGQFDDNCNYDGYANSIYTITIGKTRRPSGVFICVLGVSTLTIMCSCVAGAVDENGRMPFYAEECAAMLAVTFSSGGSKLRNIVGFTATHT